MVDICVVVGRIYIWTNKHIWRAPPRSRLQPQWPSNTAFQNAFRFELTGGILKAHQNRREDGLRQWLRMIQASSSTYFLTDPRLRLPSLQQAAARGELDMAWALGWWWRWVNWMAPLIHVAGILFVGYWPWMDRILVSGVLIPAQGIKRSIHSTKIKSD